MNKVTPFLQSDCIRGANLALQADERRVDPLKRRQKGGEIDRSILIVAVVRPAGPGQAYARTGFWRQPRTPVRHRLRGHAQIRRFARYRRKPCAEHQWQAEEKTMHIE